MRILIPILYLNKYTYSHEKKSFIGKNIIEFDSIIKVKITDLKYEQNTFKSIGKLINYKKKINH